MNYARFQEPKPERDYSGIQAEIEFDEVEIEPGHIVPIQLTGQFEWDGHNWICDRLYLHTYANGPMETHTFANGATFTTPATIEKTLRIDDRADFKTIVRAAEAWANKNYQPEDYA